MYLCTLIDNGMASLNCQNRVKNHDGNRVILFNCFERTMVLLSNNLQRNCKLTARRVMEEIVCNMYPLFVTYLEAKFARRIIR